MYRVTDQHEITLALIFRNMILDPSGKKVVGIAVGNCLFNGQSKVFGKIIQSYAYDINGRIIGNVSFTNLVSAAFTSDSLLNNSWELLTNIKEHTCPWIATGDEWSLVPFNEYL